MLVALDHFVETTDAQVHLTQTLLLQSTIQKTCIPERQVVLFLLIRLESCNHRSLILLMSILAHFEHKFVNVSAAVSANDEHPMASSSLEPMQLVLVLEDWRPLLKLLYSLGPLDESVLFKAFDRKVNRLVQVLLVESSF